jgi:4-aminobutyrate aminotransferase
MVIAEKTDKNLSYLNLDDKYVNPVLARVARIVAERASGSYIYDMNGDAYLDLASGIAVTNIGHCHPKVVEAIQKQASELIHTSVVTHHKRYIELAEKIVEITPKSLDSVMFANSGAEAVEGAIKLARYVTGRPAIINFKGSFHGRTIMTTALTTSKLSYREKYEPLPGSIFTVPFPYVYRSNYRDNPEALVDECLAQFDVLFNQFVHPAQVAAIIVEPVQGEGGYVVPPSTFLPKLRKLATEHNILLIIDEVQSGFGRTGKMFACEHSNIEPDIMLMAKGIASGMPLAGFISRRDITSKWTAGRHGTTFGGNPVSCAAALATIEVLQQEKLLERAAVLGKQMKERLAKICANNPNVGEVRGLGMMIAVEFINKDGSPSHDIAEKIANVCIDNKLLVLTCGSQAHVIRLIPPLNLSDKEADEALNKLEKSIKAVIG